MVTPRESPVLYHGLEVTIRPLDAKKAFYRTGESPEFKLVVHNTTDKRRQGKILYWLRLRMNRTINVLGIVMDAHETKEYTLNREWLGEDGPGEYGICDLPGPPEAYVNKSDDQLKKEFQDWKPVHPLCSFVIRDKDMVRSERREARVTIILLAIAAGGAIFLVVKALF